MAIGMNLKALESIHYFWVATKGREKVGEQYINSIAEMPEMAPLYEESFTKESVRKLLSGISNREMFGWNQKEGRFWNQNMYVFENWSDNEAVVSKIKVFSMAEASMDAEVVVIPGHMESCYRSGNQLTLNFFRLGLGEDGELTMEGEPLKDYVLKQLQA